ncbi:MAG: DUF99 family protein [Promethearchaeota archaeon]|nr:MAG: DUF99 family protein [Candidatus Lokiarchaeota archaeon]
MLKIKSCILAFDDGMHEKADLYHSRPHDPHSIPSLKKTSLIGVITKGLQLLHVTRSCIEIDGRDATDCILEVYNHNPHHHEIQAILIDSPTMGGFNIPDVFAIHQRTNLPVILIPSHPPTQSIVAVYRSVFPDREHEIQILTKLPPISSIEVRVNCTPEITKLLYFHAIGVEFSDIVEFLQYTTHFSAIPEPLRLAHLIASQLTIKK